MTRRHVISGCAAVLGVPALLLMCAAAPAAQQTVPFRNNIPIAPQGLTIPPLSQQPVEFHTAEGQDIRVVVVARGLAHPWSLAFLPDGGMLVTERGGALRIVRGGKLDPQPVAGVPAVRAAGLSGLMDVALHPRFAENSFVYSHVHETGRRRRLGDRARPGTLDRHGAG